MTTMDLEEKILMPREVREILGADNDEIIKLCQKISLIPKKNTTGQTYFSYEDVERLKTAQNKPSTSLTQVESQRVVNSLLESLKAMEENVTQSVSRVIDEKLDGMDEVVVELIRCKTENENLRQKLNQLNKENYNLKNMLNNFKSIGLGLFIKKKNDDFLI